MNAPDARLARLEVAAQRLLAISLGVPAIVGLVLWVVRREDASTLFMGSLLGLFVGASVLARWGPLRRAIGVWTMLAVFGFMVLWMEVGFRVAGFRFETEAVIQFGYPDPEDMIRLESDPELFWKLPAHLPVLNSLGLIGPEIRIPKPEDVCRLAFFGDSCTQQGYPKTVGELLEENAADSGPFEVLNLAVSGYSSHQGQVLARRWADRLSADVAFIYFGWNDHWQAYGVTDELRHLAHKDPNPIFAAAMSASRIVQWVGYRLAPKPLGINRVPLDRYRQNLQTMGERLSKAGSKVVLLTAPSAHERLGTPSYLVDEGFVSREGDAVSMHREYNDAVREIASTNGWILLDLEEKVQALDDLESVFMKDGIHFTPRGLNWISIEIARALIEEIL